MSDLVDTPTAEAMVDTPMVEAVGEVAGEVVEVESMNTLTKLCWPVLVNSLPAEVMVPELHKEVRDATLTLISSPVSQDPSEMELPLVQALLMDLHPDPLDQPCSDNLSQLNALPNSTSLMRDHLNKEDTNKLHQPNLLNHPHNMVLQSVPQSVDPLHPEDQSLLDVQSQLNVLLISHSLEALLHPVNNPPGATTKHIFPFEFLSVLCLMWCNVLRLIVTVLYSFNLSQLRFTINFRTKNLMFQSLF